ncbi:MAG: phosphonate ABC transporter permease, partial [Comamonas sp.]
MPVSAAPTEVAQTSMRDPAARGRLTWLVVALIVLWPMLQTSGFSLEPFFDANNLKVIGGFLAGFLPPETGSEFLGYLGQATLETLAIATAGMALAFVIAVPMSYLSTGAAREQVTLNPIARGVLTILRG